MIFSCLLTAVAAFGQVENSPDVLLNEYEKLDLDSMAKMQRKSVEFDRTCKSRMEIEFKLAAQGKKAVSELTDALKSTNRNVRMLAAKLLGVYGDNPEAGALEDAARNDSDKSVRIYAIQSLGWLKAGIGTLQALSNDDDKDLSFVAKAAQQQANADCVSKIREEYKLGLKSSEMAAAKSGSPAPSFTLLEAGGKPLKLSDYKGKKSVVLMFQLADW